MSIPASELNHIPAEVQNGSKYSNEERAQAVYAYISTGTFKRTSIATGVPLGTLQAWKHTEWWAELTAKVREEKKDEYDSSFSRIIEESMQVIEKQLKSGDVKARDAATIMGITFDKRQILNMKPTTISGKTLDISKLQGDFERFLQAKEIVSPVDTTTPTD